MQEFQIAFIQRAAVAAEQSGHIFPEMAACEAALESRYGTSDLAVADRNLFGMKQHTHPVYGTHVLPTKEFEGGEWVVVNAAWVHYPDWAACFKDRMDTLRRLAPHLPHYARALASEDPTTYVLEVSSSWATDPKRGSKVLEIFHEYFDQAPGITITASAQ